MRDPLGDGTAPTSRSVRLALTGTPRSGNAWLRLLLGDAYACQTLSSHSPAEVPWEALPADVVLQMHQHADPAFTSALEEHGFRVVVLARHPLDVLISILHFARNDPSPARWLDGEAGDEMGITTCTPLDPSFLEYATGPRARTLLALSREWWIRPEASKIRYEDLCANAAGELQALVAKLSPPRAPLEQVVRAHTLDRLRGSTPNQHFWQGHPGHWRTLLPADVANRLAEAHHESFELFGYELDPDPKLGRAEALRNWRRMAEPAKAGPSDWFAAVRATDAEDIRRLRAERFAVQARLNEERPARTRIEEGAAAEASATAVASSRSLRDTGPFRFLARLIRGAGRPTSNEVSRPEET
jgi:hypothetical protein